MLFPVIGYLSIPVGVVVSGYVKNYLLRRVCRKRELIKISSKTITSFVLFALIAGGLGVVLNSYTIGNIWDLTIAIALFGIVYLPIAYVTDRFIVK